ncbi:hypothetical protein ACFPM0_37055 [Pseudonocardia sulfidoxydans]
MRNIRASWWAERRERGSASARAAGVPEGDGTAVPAGPSRV